MSKKIKIKPHCTVIGHGDDYLEISYGIWNPISFEIKDEDHHGHLYRIVKLLDGRYTAKEIAALLNIKRSDVEQVIDHLYQLGLISEGEGNIFSQFMESTGSVYSDFNHQNEVKVKKPVVFFEKNSISLLCHQIISPILGSQFSQHLEDYDIKNLRKLIESDSWLHNGIEFEKVLKEFEFFQNKHVVVAQEIIQPLLIEKLNKIFFSLNISWTLLIHDGPYLYFGPSFSGRETACFECLQTRMLMNMRKHETYILDSAVFSGCMMQ